jgi:DNA polymerase IV
VCAPSVVVGRGRQRSASPRTFGVMPRRVIAHLDLDAFYASVELLRRPELRGKPVIVSGNGPRAVVTTATYEARKFGVGSAMPTSRALRQCPGAILIAPDFTAYREASQKVWAIVRDHVEVVEQAGIDEGYIDLTEVLSPKAAMRRLVIAIKDGTGLSASVGIGPNKLVAKVSSDLEKPGGFVVLSREMACERFAYHPPTFVNGIGPKTGQRLAAMGLTTLLDVREADPGLLRETFGENLGGFLRRRASFEDDGAVTTYRETKSQSKETTFDADIAGLPALEPVLVDLSRRLSEHLASKELAGRTIGIKVRLDDWTTITRARTLDHPTFETALVTEVALELLRAYDPQRPVRLLGVRVAGFEEKPGPAAPRDQLALPV